MHIQWLGSRNINRSKIAQKFNLGPGVLCFLRGVECLVGWWYKEKGKSVKLYFQVEFGLSTGSNILWCDNWRLSWESFLNHWSQQWTQTHYVLEVSLIISARWICFVLNIKCLCWICFVRYRPIYTILSTGWLTFPDWRPRRMS